jgi:hypothetical protein
MTDKLDDNWEEEDVADLIEKNKVIDEPVQRKKAAPTKSVEKRVRIILEENDEIPPTGQFIGHNGVGYILKPGQEASVPAKILNVLNDAIKSVPITDGSNTVIGYKDKLRFPYRVLGQVV